MGDALKDMVAEVSIHAPAWGATAHCMLQYNGYACFDPRPRVGGDRKILAAPRRCRRFDPRPRVGGDKGKWARDRETIVSIHAPAWGAT